MQIIYLVNWHRNWAWYIDSSLTTWVSTSVVQLTQLTLIRIVIWMRLGSDPHVNQFNENRGMPPQLEQKSTSR